MAAVPHVPFFTLLFVNAVAVGVSTFVAGVLVMVGSVETTRNVVATIRANPPHTLRVGFVVALAFVVVYVPLVLLSPFTRLLSVPVWFVFAVCLVFGRAYAFLYVGTVLSGRHDSPVAALLSGSASAFLLSLVPVFGQLVVGAVAVLGVGGMLGRAAVWAQTTSTPASSSWT